MKLDYSTPSFVEAIGPCELIGSSHQTINAVSIDSRTITSGEGVCFFAVDGRFKSGSNFIDAAHQKGVRVFVVRSKPHVLLEQACYLVVENPLQALQSLAAFHRKRFSYPVLAITGSIGKTTVKEWLFQVLANPLKVLRSPKSYNSQIGVALSLLELNEDADLAIIEAGISKPGEMSILADLISPTHAILTGIGSAHLDNFESSAHLTSEKLILLDSAEFRYSAERLTNYLPYELLSEDNALPEINGLNLNDDVSRWAAGIVISFAKKVGWAPPDLTERVEKLQKLAMRLETYEGKNDSIIINDTYNLDWDALKYSLEYLQTQDPKRKKVVVVGIDEEFEINRSKIQNLVEGFKPDLFYMGPKSTLPTSFPSRAVVLIKGTRASGMETYAAQFRAQQHQTKLEINLTALRKNISFYKTNLQEGVKILAMVKSQSYGSGLEKLGLFLQDLGIDYLGVAYTNEGVALRKIGVTTPILVMNADRDSYMDCIDYHLEPSAYSMSQLEDMVRAVMESKAVNLPIHIKIDTGMNRLGFSEKQWPELLGFCQGQPEIYVKGIYSHLAESGSPDKQFTHAQINKFRTAIGFFQAGISHTLIKHLVNTSAIVSYPDAHFDMVRLGIGMFGVYPSADLTMALAWRSVVSQIKDIEPGESVGYDRSFVAEQKTTIAIIPLGYGDGFSRILSNGRGCVYMAGHPCPTVGRVCMDMIMVDITKLNVQEGDPVVVFENTQQLMDLSKAMETIPYEVLTSLSPRIHRIYVHE